MQKRLNPANYSHYLQMPVRSFAWAHLSIKQSTLQDGSLVYANAADNSDQSSSLLDGPGVPPRMQPMSANYSPATGSLTRQVRFRSH